LSGARVYLPYRGDEFEYRHVKPMFDLGQFAAIPFHPRDDNSIREAIKRADVVVNFIGKHYETKTFVPTRRADGKLSRINYTFDEVHCEVPTRIAQIAKECEIPTFIHVSAMSQNKNSASEWSRSKAKGEESIRQVFPETVRFFSSKLF
jgi:NADH dehydrogenase (ubiquinone) 1 alpha subcomplex subunit 9